MLKYHVAVCDDEKSDLDGIVQSVQRYDAQGCFDIETYMDALLKKGSIQHLKVGRSYRIPKAHLLTYLIGFAPGHTIRA